MDGIRLMEVRYRTLKESPTMKSLKRVKLHKVLIWFSELCLFHLVRVHIPSPNRYDVSNTIYK